MNDSIVSEARQVIESLRLLPASESGPERSIASQWIDSISKGILDLSTNSYSVVFVGGVGVGKSSLISIAAKLYFGQRPEDRTSLRSNSVLAIGGGRTTVCEVQVRAA